MHMSFNGRAVWTVIAGVGCAGLLGSAALASGAAGGGPTLPTAANSHAVVALSAASSASTDDSSDPAETDSSDPAEPDSSDPAESDNTSTDSAPPSSTPVGPDATGPAAFGLCTAYEHAKVHGKSVGHSIAFRNLAAAAGGSDQIDAYCATVLQPGAPSSSDSASTPATDEQSGDQAPSTGSLPTPSHPTGRPTSVPSHSHPTH